MTNFALGPCGRVAYDVAGAGTQPPLVFVHGWCCDRSHFEEQFAHFASDHQVAALDLRGHGESDAAVPGSGNYSVEALAHDVRAVTEDAGLHRPVLVGHSMGALVGLTLAQPDTISALVMVDPASVTNEKAKTFFRESFSAVAADSDQSWRTAFVNGMFLPTDHVHRDEIISAMPRFSPEMAADMMLAMGEFDGVSALRKAAVPVLSIGSASPTNSSADLRSVCPAISIGQTVGSGHFIHLEVPDQVNSMISRFLAVNDLRGRLPAQ